MVFSLFGMRCVLRARWRRAQSGDLVFFFFPLLADAEVSSPPKILLAGLNTVVTRMGLWLECAMWQSNACDKSVFKDEKGGGTEIVLEPSVVLLRAPAIKSSDLMNMQLLLSHSVNMRLESSRF